MGAGLLVERGTLCDGGVLGGLQPLQTTEVLICRTISARTFWRKGVTFVTRGFVFLLLTCWAARTAKGHYERDESATGGAGPDVPLWCFGELQRVALHSGFCRLGTCLLLLSGFILKSSVAAFLPPPGCQPLCPGSCWALKWTHGLHSAGELHSQNRAPQRPFQRLNRKLTWGKRSGRTMAAFSGHREDGDELLGFRFSVPYSHVEERWWEKRRRVPLFFQRSEGVVLASVFSGLAAVGTSCHSHVSPIICCTFETWGSSRFLPWVTEVTLRFTHPPALTQSARTPLCPATLFPCRQQRMHVLLLFVTSFSTLCILTFISNGF